ncbi:MAG: DUF3052 family protein [Bacteroidetes bacterium]|nr:DUF3052 family protein [Bacteroidota bacterium]
MPSGYSSTPLARKLGIKSEYALLFYKRPDHFFDLFSDFPADVQIEEIPKTENADYIHLFFTEKADLVQTVPIYKAALKKHGLLWVSWPKGKSKIETDINREIVREELLKTGLVDIKVAAIDENWSGLKFVYRKADR